MAKSFVLITGGVRSGKSKFAQAMAEGLGEKVLFVATAEPLDEEMALRIEEHKRKRSKSWRTLEISINVGQQLEKQLGDAEVVLLDCLTLLVSNILTAKDARISHNPGEAETRVTTELEQLVGCMDQYAGTFIAVSNEVGLGLVPGNKLGRIYRDLLGMANQFLAQHATEVYFMTAGIPIKIKGDCTLPIS